MTARLRIPALWCVLALAAASELAAQQPAERKGFWIAFGFGYGSATSSCDSCTAGGREGALSGFLKMGGTPSPRLLLGGETNGWVRNDSGSTVTRGNASFAAYYYPVATSSFFLKGGVGYSVYRAQTSFVNWSGSGFGLLAGAGYDVRVGRNISLTPVINFFAGLLGSVDAPGYVGSGGYSQNIVQVALGITFH